MTLTQNVLVDGSDKLFFSQRILIMKMILKGEVDFPTFKRELKIADGSLFSHLRARAGKIHYLQKRISWSETCDHLHHHRKRQNRIQ
jgi:hypothetical protein